MTEADEVTEPAPESGWRAQVRGQRTALLTIGAVILLVLGFGVGVLLSPDEPDGTPPNTTDIGFAQDMSAHHAQAVEMSGITLTGTTDPAVQRLAYDILTTQQSQIGRMQGWLQMWGAPARGSEGYMAWMPADEHSGHGGHEHAHSDSDRPMPGMATTAEIQQLRDAEGAAQDKLFLQLMLRHHEGGVPMLEYGAAHAATTEIRVLAGQMLVAQQGEARLMTDMLTARGAAPLPMN
ncbi:DUF305 domain-containing protein [Nocardia sp. NPDC003345]